ncbi:MAG: helix-turn-helix domain-containing protein [Labilithrix sp.]
MKGEDFYREYAPAPDLREVVACGWVKVVTTSMRVPVIPDGCADVIMIGEGEPIVVGPDEITRWVPLEAGVVISALRLRPGAARAMLGLRAGELLGESGLLRDVVRGVRDLEDDLRALEAPAARVARLERWARDRLATSSAADRDRRIIAGCRMLARDPGLTMDVLADHFGWNARMLHREFVAACGYGPKYFQRIMRVQGVIREATRQDAARPAGTRMAPLSALAANLGFSDQAHMTRDFKSIVGLTPSAYLAEHDHELGRWLDEGWRD